MTSWMEERDRLLAQTQAFVQGVAAANPFRPTSPPQPAAAVGPVDAPLPVVVQSVIPASDKAAELKRKPSPISERDEITKRVAAFQAHQHRLAAEREAYYKRVQLQIRTGLGNDLKPDGL